ncbi:MAG: hypothetical protein N2114_04950, partial [Candidatus Goldbacteria bacterium]|nr:hypothetical protein [Candidatus Goldiibacteriota bacterium]
DITLIDGGREVIGGETFYVYNLKPGNELKIVRRIFNPEKHKLKVIIDSKDAGIWEQEKDYGFIEVAYTIPAHLIQSTMVRIDLREINKRKYNSFYYWFLQRRQ